MHDKQYNKNLTIILFICIVISFVIPAHTQNITLREIPSLDKLPVNAIHRIFQDSDGYMWYGTFNGLCRYDGYNIRVFRSDLLHPGLLSNNYITYIVEDHEKKIWFGTREGTYILDKATSRITPVETEGLSGKDVFTINVTRDGTIWISVSGILFRMRPDGTVLKKYTTEHNHSPQVVYIVYENNAGDLLISLTGGGMYKLNTETDEFEAYFHHPDYMNIERIIWDKTHHCYWLGTWGKGIVRFDPKQTTPEQQYVPQPLPVDILGSSVPNLFHMVQDDIFHYLWVTTERDLFAFRITRQGTLEQVDISSFLSTGNKMLYEIYKDKEGKLWVSAFDIPSFIVDIREYTVKEYPLAALRNRLKANPAIQSLSIDKSGVFWFTQERYGLYAYNPEKEQLKHYTECKATRHLPFWEVPLIIPSRTRNSVWAMPYGNTIYELKQQNEEMTTEIQIQLSDVTDNPGGNSFLYEDNYNNLWIGTTTGLFVYRIGTGNLEIVSENLGNATSVTQTNDGRIWAILKNKGLCVIDKEKQIRIYPFDKDFRCMDATSDGKLWIGTSEGEVLFFDPEKNELTDQSFACGMKGDIINSIIVDTYNHIWIATNQMIKEYNPRNGAYRSYNTRNNNFLPDRLLSQAVCYDGKGEIYYGGISGIVSLPPSQQLESIPMQVATFITDIKIMGRSIWDNELTDNPLANSIRIQPADQNLEIEFSSLDFHNLDQIRYAYRMLGIDNDWVYLDEGKNSAFYNRLSKGKYTFQVKATDKNGLWSDKITEIAIHRLPAVYETWWAYLLYIILATGVLWAILYLYLQREKQENHKKFVEKITQMKLRYFTNISHELLTPLTILSCLTDEIESPLDTDKKRVNLMQSNIKRLKRLLQQVLDFRKVESRNMKLYVSYGDIRSFIQSICEDSFAFLMKRKSISFSFIANPEKINGYFDHDKLDKILFNLLSNAFKYTPEGKNVILEIQTYVSSGHEYLTIKVKDEGKGIAPKELDRIFTRFYNNKFNDAGFSNGIGLSLTKELIELHHGKIVVESQPGLGSEFIVEIPIDKRSYTPEELKEVSVISQEQEITRMEDKTDENPDEKDLRPEYTLLLVEDNVELLLLLESIFSKTYNVVKAENGKDALDYIQAHPVDIVISDIMMPEMDGLELCKHIKNDIATSHIIVILLTAKTNIENQINSYEVGADDYVTKPFESKILKVRVESLLKKREKMQSEFRNNPRMNMISQTGFTTIDEQLIEKAFKVVEENLSDPSLDVSTLADKLNLSRSTFSRKIKAITGQTPLDFIKDIKMQHARQMLKNKSITVSEVVTALGYNDHKHFTASFKEAFGMTPIEYHKKHTTSGQI